MKKKSIVSKAMFYLLSISLFSVIIVSSILSNYILDVYFEQTHERNNEYVNRITAVFEQDLISIEASIKNIEESINTEEIFKLSQIEGGLNQFEKQTEKYFKRLLEDGKYYTNSIYIYLSPYLDNDVHDVWVTYDNGILERHEEVALERYTNNDNMSWYFDPMKSTEGKWLEPYTNRYDQLVSSFVTPLYYKNDYYGMMGMYLSFDEIEKMLSEVGEYTDDNVYIKNSSGEVLNSGPDSVFVLNDKMFYYKSMIYNGWSFTYVVPKSEVFKPVYMTLLRIIVLISVLVLVIIALTIYLRNNFKAKFLSIIDGIKKLEKGIYTHKIDLVTNDELEEIASALNNTSNKLKELTEEQYRLAYTNSVTGISNINKLLNDITGLQEKNSSLTLMHLGIDRFKDINDIVGTSKGDDILRYLGKLISKYTTSRTFVYHLYGDEFAILATGGMNDNEIEEFVEDIFSNLDEPFKISGFEFNISLSTGVARFPEHCKSSEELLKYSGIAMMESKKTEESDYVIFKDEMYENLIRDNQLEVDFKKGLEYEEFMVYYQPKIGTETNEIQSIEALARWNHRKKGVISPIGFIDYAERSGMIVELGYKVLRDACIDVKRFNKVSNKNYIMSVNVSKRQLIEVDFVKTVLKIIKDEGLETSSIELEITESMILNNFKDSINKIEELIAHGIKIALDDFGTGYSNFDNILNLKISTIKIDKSFVDQLSSNSDASKLIKGIISLSHNLGCDVVAEGVEEKEQIELLKKMNCDQLQGYYFSKPVPANDFIEYINK